MHCACVISRSSNDGKQFKDNLIRPTKLNMTVKFVENFIFLRGIVEKYSPDDEPLYYHNFTLLCISKYSFGKHRQFL